MSEPSCRDARRTRRSRSTRSATFTSRDGARLSQSGRRRRPDCRRSCGHTREWYDALDAAGIERRGPYHLRHTFATEALAAGISIFELSRVMGASVREIDRTYGHFARDSKDSIRARLEARADRTRLGQTPAEAE